MKQPNSKNLHRTAHGLGGARLNLWARALFIVAAFSASACTSILGDDEDELRDSDLKLSTPWNDFLGHSTKDKPLYSALVNGGARRSLPAALSQPEAYEGGVFGYMGSAKAFVAYRKAIPDYNRLYWVMVKVLSEKYSCFISAKQNRGDETWIQCRDKRQIVFWRDLNSKYIQFQARQFDHEGYEIAVRHHQIVRLGSIASAVGPVGGFKAN